MKRKNTRNASPKFRNLQMRKGNDIKTEIEMKAKPDTDLRGLPHRFLKIHKETGLKSESHKRLSSLVRVVKKPVNVNPGLNVNCNNIFSCLKMFLTSLCLL